MWSAERFGEQGDPAFGALAPVHTYLGAPRALHARHHGALRAVHGHHSPTHGEAGDLVGWHGGAAPGQSHGRPGHVDEDVGGGEPGRRPVGRRTRGGRAVGDGTARRLVRVGGLHCRVGREPALDGDPRGGRVGVLQPLPGGLGGGVLPHQELHGVAVAQHRAHGRQAAVDPGPHARVRVLAVLGVRGVHAGRALGQAAQGAAVGPEDGDLAVLREVLAEGGPEGVGVGGAALPVEQPGEPARPGRVDALAVARGLLLRRRCVGVAERDDSGLGDLVHLVGADEDLDDLAVLRAGHRGVQRLVQVELRYGDEVLELRDDGRHTGVQFAEDGVTVGVLLHEHQEAAEVGAAERVALAGDAVHGDEVAGPDEDFGGDVRLAEYPAHLVGDLGERVVRAGGVLGDQLPGVLVLLGVHDREDQVLQLGLERLDAEPFGERDEHVPGHLGDALLFLPAHDAEGAHVVEPVGEFDRHHADVVAGGEEHLAEGLGLGGGAVVDLLQFGDAVDEVADLCAELIADLVQRHVRVLDGVVEEGGGQGGGLGAEFGEDQRHGEGVGDVRLAALAHLAAVRGLRQQVGAAQRVEVGVGVMGAVGLDDVADGVGQPAAGGGAEQRDATQPAQVDPGAGLPARRRRRDGAVGRGRHCARTGWIDGLRIHGHLRLHGPADGVSQGGHGSGDGVGPPSGPVLDAIEPITCR